MVAAARLQLVKAESCGLHSVHEADDDGSIQWLERMVTTALAGENGDNSARWREW